MLGDRFADLLASARAGGDAAWAELYRDLAPSVRGYARGRGATDPDEVTGEVFLQLVRDLHRFNGDEAGFRSWVFTITHRRTIDAHRRTVRRRETVVAPADLPGSAAVASHEDLVLEGVTADEIAALLARLKPAYREILLLRFIGGLTVAACAEVLDKRLPATKQLLRRALNALRGELSADTYPSDR